MSESISDRNSEDPNERFGGVYIRADDGITYFVLHSRTPISNERLSQSTEIDCQVVETQLEDIVLTQIADGPMVHRSMELRTVENLQRMLIQPENCMVLAFNKKQLIGSLLNTKLDFRQVMSIAEFHNCKNYYAVIEHLDKSTVVYQKGMGWTEKALTSQIVKTREPEDRQSAARIYRVGTIHKLLSYKLDEVMKVNQRQMQFGKHFAYVSSFYDDTHPSVFYKYIGAINRLDGAILVDNIETIERNESSLAIYLKSYIPIDGDTGVQIHDFVLTDRTLLRLYKSVGDESFDTLAEMFGPYFFRAIQISVALLELMPSVGETLKERTGRLSLPFVNSLIRTPTHKKRHEFLVVTNKLILYKLMFYMYDAIAQLNITYESFFVTLEEEMFIVHNGTMNNKE